MSAPYVLATPIGEREHNLDGSDTAHNNAATFSADHSESSAPSVYSSRSASGANHPAQSEQEGRSDRDIQRSGSSDATLAGRSSLDQPESSSSGSDVQADSKGKKRSDGKDDDGWSYAKVLKVGWRRDDVKNKQLISSLTRNC